MKYFLNVLFLLSTAVLWGQDKLNETPRPINGGKIVFDWNSGGSNKHRDHIGYYWIREQNAIQHNEHSYRARKEVSGGDGCAANTIIANEKTVLTTTVPCFSFEEALGMNPTDINPDMLRDLVENNNLTITNYFAVKYHKKEACNAFNSWKGYWGPTFYIIQDYPLFNFPKVEPLIAQTCQNSKFKLKVTVEPSLNPDLKQLPNYLTYIIKPTDPLRTPSIEKVEISSITNDFFGVIPGNLGGEVEVFASYIDPDTKCETTGLSTKVPIYPYDVYTLDPPNYIPEPDCGNNNSVVVTIENPKEYTGVFWYEEPVSNNGPTFALHDNESYTFHRGNGTIQVLYAQFYNVNFIGTDPEDKCYTYSPRIPVVVNFAQNLNGFQYGKLGGNATIYDYRVFPNSHCDEKDPLYPKFVDLPTIDATTGDAIINSIRLPNEIPLNDPCISVSYSISSTRWVPVSGDLSLPPYYIKSGQINSITGNDFRVCADHISKEIGKYSSKEYQLYVDVNFIIEYCSDVSNEEVNFKNDPIEYACSFKVLGAKYTVTTRESGTIGETCVIDFESVLALTENNSNICDENEVLAICNDGRSYEIGPTYALIKEMYEQQTGRPLTPLSNISYNWTPIIGLSDPNIARPTVSYESIPINDGQAKRYICKINISDAGFNHVLYYCAYIYKCSSCTTNSTIPGTTSTIE